MATLHDVNRFTIRQIIHDDNSTYGGSVPSLCIRASAAVNPSARASIFLDSDVNAVHGGAGSLYVEDGCLKYKNFVDGKETILAR